MNTNNARKERKSRLLPLKKFFGAVANFSLPFENKRQRKTIGLRPFLLGAVLRLRSLVALPVSTANFVAVRWSSLSRLARRCTEYTSLAHAARLLCAAARHRLSARPSSRDPLGVQNFQILHSLHNQASVRALESGCGLKNDAKISEVVQLEKKISEWLGEGTKLIRNEAGDSVFLSKDGMKCVRFDFNYPNPHNSPHAHVEIKVDGKWIKSGQIYPINVQPN